MARGLHFSGLTDAVWTPNGNTLIVSSCDGYLSFLTFSKGELGSVYHKKEPLATTSGPEEPVAKKARVVTPATKSLEKTGTFSDEHNILQPRKKHTEATLISPSESSGKSDSVKRPPVAGGMRNEPNILQPKKKKRVALTSVSSA